MASAWSVHAYLSCAPQVAGSGVGLVWRLTQGLCFCPWCTCSVSLYLGRMEEGRVQFSVEECGGVGLWKDEGRVAECVMDGHSELVGSEGWGLKWGRSLVKK